MQIANVCNVAVASNAVCMLCSHLERHVVVGFFSMFKINATAWPLHSVLDSALWGCCSNAVGSSRALWARCKDAI